jgi:hypothetical protein
MERGSYVGNQGSPTTPPLVETRLDEYCEHSRALMKRP